MSYHLSSTLVNSHQSKSSQFSSRQFYSGHFLLETQQNTSEQLDSGIKYDEARI